MLEFSSNVVRSSCNDNASDMLFIVLKIFVSSAKVAMLEFDTLSERWFSYKRNSKGPRIEPCGTPDVTAKGLDVAPPTVVC